MEQPYVRSAPYGASLSNRITSNYGTITPMPSNVPDFMGATPTGELLGTAADDSNTAQYTPITHAVRLNKDTMLFREQVAAKTTWTEGTLVMIKPTDADNEISLVEKGSQDENNSPNTLSRQGLIRPVAADAFFGDVKTRRKNDPFFVTLAWAGVAVVKIPKGNPDLGEAVPCQNVFARMTEEGIQLRWTRARNGDQLLGRLVVGKTQSDTLLYVSLDP